MLVLFEKISQRCGWLRIPCFLAFSAMIVVSAWILIAASVTVQDRWLIPAIVATLWFLLSGSVLSVFVQTPTLSYENLSWTGKITKKLLRLFYHLLAWFMLIVSLALLVVSLQLMMAWFRSL
jgi:hypothetical protein